MISSVGSTTCFSSFSSERTSSVLLSPAALDSCLFSFLVCSTHDSMAVKNDRVATWNYADLWEGASQATWYRLYMGHAGTQSCVSVRHTRSERMHDAKKRYIVSARSWRT